MYQIYDLGIWGPSGIIRIWRESPPVWKQSYSETILIKFDLSSFRCRRFFFSSTEGKDVGTWTIRSLQRLSPSSSFEVDYKICQRNLTRIDRTKCFATRIGLVVSDDGAWMASGVSAKSAQRAQFTI